MRNIWQFRKDFNDKMDYYNASQDILLVLGILFIGSAFYLGFILLLINLPKSI